MFFKVCSWTQTAFTIVSALWIICEKYEEKKYDKRVANRPQLLPGRICTVLLLLEPNVPHWYSEGQTETMVSSTVVSHPSPSPFHFGVAAKHFVYMWAILAALGSHTQTHKDTQISFHRLKCTMSLVHKSTSLVDTVDLKVWLRSLLSMFSSC